MKLEQVSFAEIEIKKNVTFSPALPGRDVRENIYPPNRIYKVNGSDLTVD